MQLYIAMNSTPWLGNLWHHERIGCLWCNCLIDLRVMQPQQTAKLDLLAVWSNVIVRVPADAQLYITGAAIAQHRTITVVHSGTGFRLELGIVGIGGKLHIEQVTAQSAPAQQ